MVGPRDFSPSELERCGLGKVQRRLQPDGTLTRLYCLRCGAQVAAERRDIDPDGWWACARGCNTRFAMTMTIPPSSPPP